MLRLVLFLQLSIISSVVFSAEISEPLAQDIPTEKWREFNLNAVKHYIMPAYERLNHAAKTLDDSVKKHCLAKSSPESINQAREAFHQTMDAWQYIQNIQFGPIQLLMRNYSMQFWPDKRNHVSKHLTMLLATNDPNALTDEEFHKISVSTKGLPAIERFLFEKILTQQLKQNTFHCQVLSKISLYLVNTSSALVDEWQDMQQEFAQVSNLESYFEDDIEATTVLLKALIEPLEVIRDLKLLRPLEGKYGQQKITRFESWRSQRSLRNIKLNIESLSELYNQLSKIITLQENTLIKERFKLTLDQISMINSPIESSIKTQTGFEQIKQLSDSLKTLHALLENSVTNQGIHLGFNSRDGD